MATDISGIWDFVWNGNPDIIQQYALVPETLPDPLISQVCFVSVGDGYRGRFHYAELPERSYPNWPYDSNFDAHILSSSAQGQEYDTVSMVVSYRSSEDVWEYDAYEAFAGQVRTVGEPAPIMSGFLYGNNGDFAVWKMTKNVSLDGCPESLFEG